MLLWGLRQMLGKVRDLSKMCFEVGASLCLANQPEKYQIDYGASLKSRSSTFHQTAGRPAHHVQYVLNSNILRSPTTGFAYVCIVSFHIFGSRPIFKTTSPTQEEPRRPRETHHSLAEMVKSCEFDANSGE